MNTENAIKIMEYARQEAPKEMCGLLVMIEGKEVFWPCNNRHEAIDGFFMDPKDFVEAEDTGDIIAVVHSHPRGDTSPSPADVAGIRTTKITWYIVNPFTWNINEVNHADHC